MRDSFLTNQLFWNRTSRKVYSDSFVHIVRTDHILEGYGFESDEQMNAYNLKHPTGIIPVERNRFGTTAATTTQTDSNAKAPAGAAGRRRAPAAQ